jgi:hypothetical protein
MHGRYQSVRIESIPIGANIKLNGDTVKTPIDLYLFRGNPQTVYLEKEGYERSNITFTPHKSGWFWWNIFCGPLFMGYIIDLETGGAYNLKPKNATVELIKKYDDYGTLERSKGTFEDDTNKGSMMSVEHELERLEKMKEDGKISDQEYKILREKLIEKY